MGIGILSKMRTIGLDIQSALSKRVVFCGKTSKKNDTICGVFLSYYVFPSKTMRRRNPDCRKYVGRKVRIGTIPELSLRKVGILHCPPIPELYRTILELRKGIYRVVIGYYLCAK